MQSRSEGREDHEKQEHEQEEVSRLLERTYRLAGGDTHKAVDLQSAGRELGLSLKRMMLLVGPLVGQGYLLPKQQPDRMALYLTPKAVKQVSSIQTRR